MLKLVLFFSFCAAFALLIPNAEATREGLIADTGVATVVSVLCGLAFLLSVIGTPDNRSR